MSQESEALNEKCWREILIEIREIRIRLAVVGEQIKDLADHEERIRALESGRWPIPSIAAAISVAALVMSLLK